MKSSQAWARRRAFMTTDQLRRKNEAQSINEDREKEQFEWRQNVAFQIEIKRLIEVNKNRFYCHIHTERILLLNTQ